MSNVIKFRPAEFVNIDGKPLSVSMKKLVQELVADTVIVRHESNDHRGLLEWFSVECTKGYPKEQDALWEWIGSGATEEAAWRDAYTRITELRA